MNTTLLFVLSAITLASAAEPPGGDRRADHGSIVADYRAASLTQREEALRPTVAPDTCWPHGVWGDNLWCLAALPLNQKTDLLQAGDRASQPSFADRPLYVRQGTDPSFAALLESGVIQSGQRFFAGPVTGSRIEVNHARLERQVGQPGPIPKDIGLHTQASGGISRRDFAKWTRWYQEDGNVQVFRLFKGEQNVRDGTGTKGSRGRVEVYSKSLTVAPGTWREWEGTYTIVEPVGACIFQLMHEGSLWPLHIDMTAAGEVHFLRRREEPGLARTISLAKDLAGQSIRIKVRANGTDYEVYQKAPLGDGPWTLVTKGAGPKAESNKIQFRWGMYCGSKKGLTVPKDALLFVTGVIIR